MRVARFNPLWVFASIQLVFLIFKENLFAWRQVTISANHVQNLPSQSDAGGLTARSGTEFTWSPQLRNSAEWDWVQIFLENKYGGECRHGRTMSFCSVLSFPAYKYQEKVSMNFFNGPFGHQKAWSMNSSWLTSLLVIRDLRKFSYYYLKLREFLSDHLAPSLIFFHLQWY